MQRAEEVIRAMHAKTAGIADIAQKAAGHAVFANDDP